MNLYFIVRVSLILTLNSCILKCVKIIQQSNYIKDINEIDFEEYDMKVKLVEDILTEKVWVQIAAVDNSLPVPKYFGDPVWYLTTNKNQKADIDELTNQLKTGKVTGYKQTFFSTNIE